jgi:hypothetical protein
MTNRYSREVVKLRILNPLSLRQLPFGKGEPYERNPMPFNLQKIAYSLINMSPGLLFATHKMWEMPAGIRMSVAGPEAYEKS